MKKIKEDVQEVLDEPIQEVVVKMRQEQHYREWKIEEPLELTEEEVAVEVAEVEEIVEEIV